MRQLSTLGVLEHPVTEALHNAIADQIAQRIWERDTRVWKTGDPKVEEAIKNRLGWLDLPERFDDRIPEIKNFASDVLKEGFGDIVLLGMGGSSLCVEVLRDVIGIHKGHPRFHVLDSTHPDQVDAVLRAIDMRNTFFIVASKSGTTLESDCLYRFFWTKVRDLKGPMAGTAFCAITDKGSELQKIAGDQRFRKTFINPSDVGGRFSALSYFGMVPAALMGIDLMKLFERAEDEAELARAEDESNLPLRLGVILATAARHGRDKITMVSGPAFQSFGPWAEQLIAESTGKEGKGLLPVVGEHGLSSAAYGDDRLFVYFQLGGSKPEELGRYPGPLVHIHLEDAYDLGAEFFRWEFATAIAGALMNINPFDEPNVTESKTNTNNALSGKFKWTSDVPTITIDESFARAEGEKLKDYLTAKLQPGKYLAVLAYLARTAEAEKQLEDLRKALEEKYRVAVTIGFGPRYLHSTGQLHKGGPDNGVFLQLIDNPRADLPIPDKPFDFRMLVRAQADGDLESLVSKGKPVMRVDFGRRQLWELRAGLGI